MNRYSKCLTFLTIIFFFLSVFATEKTIPKEQVPQAVLQSFSQHYPNATVKRYALEKENGKTYYEIESKEGAISRDLLFTPDGKIAEVEESIPYDSLPLPVRDSINSKYGKKSFISAEKVLRNDKTTFSVVLLVNNKKQEVNFNPDGSMAESDEAGQEGEESNESED